MRLVILSNPENLGLFGAPRAKSFATWHLLQRWHKTSHMPTLRTLITNPHVTTLKSAHITYIIGLQEPPLKVG
jgi:hypothetical protein